MRLPPETEAQQKKGGGKKAARKRWREKDGGKKTAGKRRREKDGGQRAAGKGRRAKGGGQRAAGKGRRAKGGGQRAISAGSAPLRGKKRFGRQKSLTKHAKNGKLYHAGFASGPPARARSRGRPPIRPAAAGTQTNLQRCLSGLRSTTGNRVYLVRVPRVQIPLSAPNEHSFYGCSFIL